MAVHTRTNIKKGSDATKRGKKKRIKNFLKTKRK